MSIELLLEKLFEDRIVKTGKSILQRFDQECSKSNNSKSDVIEFIATDTVILQRLQELLRQTLSVEEIKPYKIELETFLGTYYYLRNKGYASIDVMPSHQKKQLLDMYKSHILILQICKKNYSCTNIKICLKLLKESHRTLRKIKDETQQTKRIAIVVKKTANLESKIKKIAKRYSNYSNGYEISSRKIIISEPRKLPNPSKVITKNGQTIAIADISFDNQVSFGSSKINSLEYIQEVEKAGGRLVIWIDHHDFDAVIPLWTQVQSDSRFVLIPRQQAPACPQLITNSVTADTYIIHNDFDGIMSGAKLLFGNKIKHIYPTIDEDAVVADARIEGQYFSNTGEILYGAIKAGNLLLDENLMGYIILDCFIEAMKKNIPITKTNAYVLIDACNIYYQKMTNNSLDIQKYAIDYGGILTSDVTMYVTKGFDPSLIGKNLAKQSRKGIAIITWLDGSEEKYTFFINTAVTQLNGKNVFGQYVNQFVPFKFSIPSKVMKQETGFSNLEAISEHILKKNT